MFPSLPQGVQTQYREEKITQLSPPSPQDKETGYDKRIFNEFSFPEFFVLISNLSFHFHYNTLNERLFINCFRFSSHPLIYLKNEQIPTILINDALKNHKYLVSKLWCQFFRFMKSQKKEKTSKLFHWKLE